MFMLLLSSSCYAYLPGTQNSNLKSLLLFVFEHNCTTIEPPFDNMARHCWFVY